MALTSRNRPDKDRLGRPGIDWKALRDRIDLAAVATALMGPAPGRRGERGRRLWWSCPFHEDANPSLGIDPGKAWWRCFGCDEKGDAANLVMRLRGLPFPEAVRWLADFAGAAPTPDPARLQARARLRQGPHEARGRPRGDDRPRGRALVEAAADRLWTPEGAAALAGLRARGLDDETIRAARLGMTRPSGRPPGTAAPTPAGCRHPLARGRPADAGEGPPARGAEAEVRRSLPGPARPLCRRPRPARPARPHPRGGAGRLARPGHGRLALRRGDDGIGQRPARCAAAGRLLPAWPWLVATDADEAGDRAAAAWAELAPGRAGASGPPAPARTGPTPTRPARTASATTWPRC